MASFAIKVYDFGEDDEFFVGEDERLWDWLVSSNCSPSDRYGFLKVPVPEDYAILDEMLVSQDSDAARLVSETCLKDWTYVSCETTDEDKARILILSPFKFLAPIKTENFLALGLNEDRVFEITI